LLYYAQYQNIYFSPSTNKLFESDKWFSPVIFINTSKGETFYTDAFETIELDIDKNYLYTHSRTNALIEIQNENTAFIFCNYRADINTEKYLIKTDAATLTEAKLQLILQMPNLKIFNHNLADDFVFEDTSNKIIEQTANSAFNINFVGSEILDAGAVYIVEVDTEIATLSEFRLIDNNYAQTIVAYKTNINGIYHVTTKVNRLRFTDFTGEINVKIIILNNINSYIINYIDKKQNDIIDEYPLDQALNLSYAIQNNIMSRRILALKNGANLYKQYVSNEIIRINQTTYGVHDCTIIYTNSILYTLYVQYDATIPGGDSASNPSAKLLFDRINPFTKEKIDTQIVAENGKIYNESLVETGGAGSPTMYLTDNIIHILYIVKINDIYTQFYCEYNIINNQFQNYNPVYVNGIMLNYEWINYYYKTSFSSGAYTSAQANCTIGNDGNGNYYIGWVCSSGTYKNAIIFKTTDHYNWQIFFAYPFKQISIYELAVWYKDSHIYAMSRPHPNKDINNNTVYTNNTAGILVKLDLNANIKEYCMVPNCSSRPAFFEVNNELYLFSNPYTRNNFEIYKIDTANIMNSLKIIEGYDGFSYPSFSVFDNIVYMISSNNKIMISKFTLPNISEGDIFFELVDNVNLT